MARPDPMLERIEAFNRNHGGRVIVRHVASGYSLHSERSGGPVARLKPTGERATRSVFSPGIAKNGAPAGHSAFQP
jgi:hypothetical protein